MGQKVNPIGLRLSINRTWESRWYANSQDYANLLHEDLAIRAYLKKSLKQAGVSRIVIERPHKKCRVTVYAARPGVIIGKKGEDISKPVSYTHLDVYKRQVVPLVVAILLLHGVRKLAVLKPVTISRLIA